MCLVAYSLLRSQFEAPCPSPVLGPSPHMPGIISNHNLQHVSITKFQNVRNVVSFIHFPCIPITASHYGLFQEIFYVHNKTQTLLVEKHICQFVYIVSFIHNMAVNLHLTSVCLHSSNNSADNVSVQFVSHIFSTVTVPSPAVINTAARFISQPQYTVTLYGTAAYIYLRITQPTTSMPNLCASWVHIV
jgi:hypothetical protein